MSIVNPKSAADIYVLNRNVMGFKLALQVVYAVAKIRNFFVSAMILLIIFKTSSTGMAFSYSESSAILTAYPPPEAATICKTEPESTVTFSTT